MAQRAPVILFDPEAHAALVEGVVALSPHDHAVLATASVHLGFGLTSQAGIHNLDPTDGAGVALDIPAPHGDRVPLLEREHLGSSLPCVVSPAGLAILHHFHLHWSRPVLHLAANDSSGQR